MSAGMFRILTATNNVMTTYRTSNLTLSSTLRHKYAVTLPTDHVSIVLMLEFKQRSCVACQSSIAVLLSSRSQYIVLF